jgi:hypothetical protein
VGGACGTHESYEKCIQIVVTKKLRAGKIPGILATILFKIFCLSITPSKNENIKVQFHLL